MKKANYDPGSVVLILLVMLSSCTYSQSFFPVRGTGTPVNKDYNVQDFKGIDVSGGFDVILVQGNTESVTLTAQENLFDHFTVKVENGILKIYTRNNIMSTREMKARINFRNINSLEVSGGGDISAETTVNTDALEVNVSGGGDLKSVINSEELRCHITGGGDAVLEGKTSDYYLNVSGGGDMKSKVDAGFIECRIAGGGDLYLRNNSRCSMASIDINGGGNMDVTINADKLKCSVTGGGDASISGQASEFEIHLNGGGDANTSGLLTDIITFAVSGGSDIHVNVAKELSGYISGGGDLYYTGNPEKVSVDAKGGSKVHKE